ADRDHRDPNPAPVAPGRLLRRLLRGRPPPGCRPGHDEHRDDSSTRALRGVDLGLGAARAPRRTQRHVPRRHVSSISADWVLPVDGPPIAGGGLRYEDERIVEVGRGRAERHFDEAAIVPGFVNAHTHLEYAN